MFFFSQTNLNNCNFLQDISHLLDVIVIMNKEFIYCEHLNNRQHSVHIVTILDVLIVNFLKTFNYCKNKLKILGVLIVNF